MSTWPPAWWSAGIATTCAPSSTRGGRPTWRAAFVADDLRSRNGGGQASRPRSPPHWPNPSSPSSSTRSRPRLAVARAHLLDAVGLAIASTGMDYGNAMHEAGSRLDSGSDSRVLGFGTPCPRRRQPWWTAPSSMASTSTTPVRDARPLLLWRTVAWHTEVEPQGFLHVLGIGNLEQTQPRRKARCGHAATPGQCRSRRRTASVTLRLSETAEVAVRRRTRRRAFQNSANLCGSAQSKV